MRGLVQLTAVCFAGFTMSGCMQSMPTAEALTRPTQQAFARLTSWTPWRAPAQPEPIVLGAVPQPDPGPVTTPEAPSGDPAGPDASRPSARALPSGSARVARAARPRPAPVVDAAIVPAKLICRTASQAGERVRMECQPAP